MIAFIKRPFVASSAPTELECFNVPKSDSLVNLLPGNLDRLGALSRYQHLQQSGRVLNASRDGYEWFGHRWILLRQCLKTRTDIVELIDFAQDRLKGHGHTALSLKSLRWENFR